MALVPLRAHTPVIAAAPGRRTALGALLEEAITHPFPHHLAQVVPATPRLGAAAELRHRRAHLTTLATAPGLRATLGSLLVEAFTHPLTHHPAQVTPAAPGLGTAAELLHGRAHRAALATAPGLRATLGTLLHGSAAEAAPRAHHPRRTLLRPLTLPLPHPGTTRRRPHRAAVVAAGPGSLGVRRESRAQHQGGGAQHLLHV